VRSLFKASKVGQIAGVYVTDGKLTNSSKIRVYRAKELVITTRLSSLKRFKDDAKEVLQGFECGLTLNDNFNLEAEDILEAFGEEEVKKNG
ncbi:MAG: translation initiation factor IF-2, partial [Bacilli bacterium]